jgi:hypothetical protein
MPEPRMSKARQFSRRAMLGAALGAGASRFVPSQSFGVSAIAEDGIIEAIEYTRHPFALGVQWHPREQWLNKEIPARFDELMENPSIGVPAETVRARFQAKH